MDWNSLMQPRLAALRASSQPVRPAVRRPPEGQPEPEDNAGALAGPKGYPRALATITCAAKQLNIALPAIPRRYLDLDVLGTTLGLYSPDGAFGAARGGYGGTAPAAE